MSANKIMIVDDSPTTTSLVKLHLIKLGYEVSGTAETAEVAMQLINNCPPDLVLMDIQLGEGMNGIEAADIIMDRFNIPVIYVTSYSDDETLDRAKLSMPFGFINKPFRANDLKVNIEIALSRTTVSSKQHVFEDNFTLNEIHDRTLEFSFISEALDHLTSGIILIDNDLQIYFKNKSACTLLEDNPSFRIKGKRLACSNSRVKRKLIELLDKKTNVVFTIDNYGEDLHVLIFPLMNPESYNVNHHSGSILFIFDTVRDSERIEDIVRTIYKLSPTEAKIASKLVFNPYLTDIASSLGITYNTARTHLKRIYQKTETNKLPALIQKIVTGPAGLLIHSIE